MPRDRTPAEPVDLDAYLAGRPFVRAVHERLAAILAGFGEVEVRPTRSQIAYRRRRGFAFLWAPGQYLRQPAAEAVVSIAARHEIASPRWKEVVRPAPGSVMHHLEVRALDDLDAEVEGWLREAWESAG